MDIQAAVVRDGHRTFEIESLNLRAPAEDEILVRLVAVGLCHTDIGVRDSRPAGAPPMVLGHEGAGVVVATGSRITKVEPGDHVVMSYASCGHCANCETGRPTYCQFFVELNVADPDALRRSPLKTKSGEVVVGHFFGQSAFATHAIASERNVVKVPRDLALGMLAPLGCGIQTGVGAVLNALDPPAGSTIAIFGAGAVGLAATMGAVIAGCTRIMLVDIKPDRLQLGKELGATHIIDGAKEDAVAQIRLLTDGAGVDFTLDCTGVPKVIDQAVDVLRTGGVCGLVGVPPAGATGAFDLNALLTGRTVRGIIEGDSIPDIFIPRLIDLWRAGRLPYEKLIRFYDFADINRAVEDAEQGRTIKAVLTF